MEYLQRELRILSMILFGSAQLNGNRAFQQEKLPVLAVMKQEEGDADEPVLTKKSRTRGIINALFVYLAIITAVLLLRYGRVPESVTKRDLRVPKSFGTKYSQRLGSHFHFADTGIRLGAEVQGALSFKLPQVTSQGHPASEIFTVSDPEVVRPSYGFSLYSTQLMNHTFGNSYGHPFVTKFSPPANLKFNKVVVTLETSVSFVQYDRLAHLYVAGNEVWRTSTIEPGGRPNPSFSIFQKDISDFANLFNQESEIIFQLDNVIDKNIQGAFQTILNIDFYYDPHQVTEFTGDYKIFSTNKPADLIYPLIELSPPVTTIEDVLTIQLPKVFDNSTRLILRIFSSGNGDEEFWYTGVLDENTQMFGQSWGGHGPVRILNVFFNGQKISTFAPEPILFTGGVSPALWRPVVCTDAFDLPAYDVDITGLLPYLWESSSQTSRELQIQISNGIGEIGRAQSTSVGNGWITTASLLAYENNEVTYVNGTIDTSDHNQHGTVFATSPSSRYVQIISTSFYALVQSTLSFSLKNGKTVKIFTNLFSKSGTYNIQGIYNDGNLQNMTHYGRTFTSFSISDEVKNQVYELNSTFLYPLVLDTSASPNPDNSTNYIVELNHVKEKTLEVNSEKVYELITGQSGHSNLVFSTSRNYGYASGNTNYTLNVNEDFDSFKFDRLVVTVNNTVVSDDSSRGAFSPFSIRNGQSLLNRDNFLGQIFSTVNETLSSTDNLAQIAKSYFQEFTAWNW
ncbi:uncharacterized protein CANTADRAFT_27108 [Suhomyces tanzawaensis NRRL Y-17324]|uniref:Peptide N-acetyl-beta-D-glucosaminyl asparaginase amidase A N-terminal domain-containing protein n=1 Tax=Suhomyces tanzawaensis NRRL Y-17324 TaxID=984487 RepID=A0A1E4SCR4_9ASCO|nr:uncharacterized protein CANTADRAFT_27108 [Suhomyces tanzawaensis NRRL Y-17324]ODV77182.1 hypothetical protein CANTADRAFT_27108 [Suhomyces tanzawaensis NRRL Y-17324]